MGFDIEKMARLYAARRGLNLSFSMSCLMYCATTRS